LLKQSSAKKYQNKTKITRVRGNFLYFRKINFVRGLAKKQAGVHRRFPEKLRIGDW
jgi:hypothetical protein